MKSSTTTTTTVFISSSSSLFVFVSCYSLLLLLSSHSHSVVFVVDSFSLSSEREALLTLLNNNFSFDDRYPVKKLNWNNLSSSNISPCHWVGIGCNTQNTHVVSLNLSGHLIYGQLGPQIGRLSYLKSLDLGNNKFNGSIPIELWNCSHLQRLDLNYNEFTGELPEAVGNLQQLNFLDISDNHFSGEIPTELWNCSHLQLLDLSYNNFTGVLPEAASNLQQLNYLSISRNHLLSGRIPESLFKISSGLETVLMDFNNFSGSIPLSIGNYATNMKRLDLYGNSLHGTIPTSIANCTKLETLVLSRNGGLSGEIPLGVWRIPTLVDIYVNDNNLSGELPVEMTAGLLHHLSYIDLSNNHFSGVIPKALGINSSNLAGVYFGNNSFSGEIPPSICNLMSSLQDLDLSDNLMNGTLPHCLGDFFRLRSMNLRNNDFTGTIPPNFTSYRLYMLDFNGNRFEGKIPRIHSQELTYLDFGNNQLEDTFPFFLGEILAYSFEILVLRSNKLYGPLERLHGSSNSSFSGLKVLDISSNYFTGDLPLEFFLGLEAMRHIYLVQYTDDKPISYRGISSVVIHKGREMGLNLTFLDNFRAIDMSNNTFQGTIPESIGDLLNLTMLNLSNNNFNGPIPSSLGNLAQLESLDLSRNKLFGEIPRHLTDIHSLAALNLSYNNLTGQIPYEAGQFSTFTNDSFCGNSGLCGLQMSRKCGTPDPIKEKESYEDSNNSWSFGWEPVVVGYGCGILIGLVVQYFLFTKDFLYRWFG